MAVEIRQHAPGKDTADFIRAGHNVFAGDPAWIAPLNFELRQRLSPSGNPFFGRAEVMLFTAWCDGELVGRCSAQIDREHLRVHADNTGFFGFFDTIDDVSVASALIDCAADWLRARGMKRMMGPFSLYVNEEVGILVEGFEHPPVMFMAHSRPYQAALCEATGLKKETDLLAWRYDDPQLPLRAQKAWEDVQRMPEVRLRSLDLKHMQREIEIVMAIYNDAWSGKWAFVPALPDEVRKLAQDLKLILDPDIAFIAEVNGEPAGMCITLPNLNEAIADLHGELLPLGFAKLLYRLKVKHPISTRLMMLGIREDVRKQRRYGGLSAAMYVETARRGLAKGYKWGELSWTRENDAPINVAIKMMGARVYKRYRVFQKNL
ncbi:MAG TPA: hypothetical protein VF331_01375 [Polyangiales bacterium]